MVGLIVLFSLCYSAVASVPQVPNTYHVTGTIYLPKSDIMEPFEAWFNADKGMSRIDYYGGNAQIINRGDVGQYGAVFKIVFETTKEVMNKKTCFAVNGSSDGRVTPQGIFPNMSNFIPANITRIYNDQVCDLYYYGVTEGSKQNAYTVFSSQSTHTLMAFVFKGYDNVFGSHYDEYAFEYDKIETNFDSSVFDIYQRMSCGPYLGPGLAHAMHANPAFELVGSSGHDESLQSAQLNEQFDKFKKKHGKVYHSDKEHEQHKNNFHHNSRYIDSKNRMALTYSLAINHMTDFSDDELKVMKGYRPSKGPKGGIEFTSDVSVDSLPDTWDWRILGAVSPIKDQGICGSCWSFGTTGTIEGAYFLKHKVMVTMSEQALVDCSWGYGNNGCDGGETDGAYEWIMDNGCIPTEDTYGQYLQQDGYCHNKAALCGAMLSNYTKIPSGDLQSLRTAIATNGPVAVAIDASHKSFSFYGYGVYYEEACGNKEDDLDHSVLAIGYGTLDGQDYWLIKNSWSPFWGNQGYVLMSQKDNNCGVATDADFAIVK